ncbi:hypothetical protein JKP88DRAFT_226426 [Tribonema minus]|uniref:Protein kinase domain-containing protein n=1 Tax=Tribonema minus TaxID=303371 RepID=A0A835YLT2_9STRA|nr:hypothetical protein JKP88DRAFT_226426 [Tribonema minus]
MFAGNVCLRHRDGNAALLPVSDPLFISLTMSDSELKARIQAESLSHARGLGDCLSTALRRAPLVEPTDEITLAGFLDSLIVPISDWVARRFDTSLKRKRNCHEDSLTTGNDRPDAVWSVDGAVLLKGEDKKLYKEMRTALGELVSKLAEWSNNYHGKVEYLVCYALAANKVQFCAVPRTAKEGGNSGGAPAAAIKLGPELNLQTTSGVLSCVHHIILLTSIICLQSKQLPASFIPIGVSFCKSAGTTITFNNLHVVKSVALTEEAPMTNQKVSFLERVYESVKGHSCIVQAIKGPQVKAGKCHNPARVYEVALSPVGAVLSSAPAELSELYNAVRCILQGLKALHRAGFGHGDLRWPNVILTTASQFVLIDLEGAMQLGSVVDLGENVPRAWENGAVLEDGRYTAKSDLRQLANMVKGCAAAGSVVTALQDADTAREALERIEEQQQQQQS